MPTVLAFGSCSGDLTMAGYCLRRGGTLFRARDKGDGEAVGARKEENPMENGLFRKKSMERISSPEELHDYMRVTSPRLWMILGAIVALLVGFIVYASTATMENTMPITVSLSHYEIPGEDTASGETEKLTGMVAYLPHAIKDQVDLGMKVRLGKVEGYISWIGVQPNNEVVLEISTDNLYVPLPEGDYEAELVLESTTPISFLWN